MCHNFFDSSFIIVVPFIVCNILPLSIYHVTSNPINPISDLSTTANTLRAAAKALLDPLIADPTSRVNLRTYVQFSKAVHAFIEVLESRWVPDDSSPSRSPGSPQSSPDQTL